MNLQFDATLPKGRSESVSRGKHPAPTKLISLPLAMSFFSTHVLLAILVQREPWLATWHGWSVLILGVGWILLGREQYQVFYVAAYIAGVEAFWRMVGADVFWEYGKYATVMVLFAYLARQIIIRSQLRLHGLSIAYFIALLPSSLLTMMRSSQIREDLSFNLSGPLSLALCVNVFSQVPMNMMVLYYTLLALLLGVIPVGVSALISTLTHVTYLYFTLSSNLITSGGFGPNQVSAVLGLGAFVAFLLAILDPRCLMRALYIGIGLWLLAHALLTFSRGGVLNVFVSLLLVGSQYVRDKRLRRTFLGVGVVVVLVLCFMFWLSLNQFTGGMLIARYTELDTTNRTEIMKADIRLFLSHPLWGVGVGMARYERANFLGKRAAAHTEFTRLLAEHGIMGLWALVVLFVIAFRSLRSAPTPFTRGIALAFAGWALTEMFHSAMRIVAVSFTFGLSQVIWGYRKGER